MSDSGNSVKKDERHENKWLLCAPVRKIRHRDVDQYRLGHLDGREQAELNRRHRFGNGLHTPDDNESVRDLLVKRISMSVTSSAFMAGFIIFSSLNGFLSGMSRHAAVEDPVWGGSFSINYCCTTRAATAMTRAAAKASFTPIRSPHIPMKMPPINGPRAMGMRRTRECMLTPMVRLF